MLYEDRTIICRDCTQPFAFTAREQAFFAERGFTPPIRCVACRRVHKARRQQSDAVTGVDTMPSSRGEMPRHPDRGRARDETPRVEDAAPRSRRPSSGESIPSRTHAEAGGRDDYYTLDWADVMPPVVNGRSSVPAQHGWDDREMRGDWDAGFDGRDRRGKSRRRNGGRPRREERSRGRYVDDWDD